MKYKNKKERNVCVNILFRYYHKNEIEILD